MIKFLTGLSLIALLSTCQASPRKAAWRISGDFGEVCSCSVPCTCNFGEGPSPAHFCWAMFTLAIKEGDYDGIKLSGLNVTGVVASKGYTIYLDRRATHQQLEALKAVSRDINKSFYKANGIDDPSKAPEGMKFLGFKVADLAYSQDDKKMFSSIAGVGAFGSKYILGIDGKTPVRMSNNWSWNLTECIKAKTTVFRYKDQGQSMDYEGRNSNVGKFDWSDTTPIYFR